MPRLDAELRAAAQARQRPLYAVALVALGDSGRAVGLVSDTLAHLLSHGGGEVQPGQLTREHLARAILREVERAGTGRGTGTRTGTGTGSAAPDPTQDPRWSVGEADDVAAAAARALRAMQPQDRVALAFHEFDDVPQWDAEGLASTEHHPASVERATARLAGELESVPWAPSGREALQRTLDRLPGPVEWEVVESSWRRSRRRHRVVAVAFVAAVAAAGAAIWWWGTDSPPEAPPVVASSSPLPSSTNEAISVDGVRMTLAVPTAAEVELPALERAESSTGLHARVALPDGPITALGPGVTGDRSVRAVLIRRLPDGTGRAVLYVPRGTPEYVEVVDVVIPARTPGAPQIGPRTISDDRRQLVLLEADAVAFVDTVSGAVTRVPVEHDGTHSIGWAQGSTWAVLESDTRPFRVKADSAEVQPMAAPGGWGRRRVEIGAIVSLVDYDWQGVPSTQRELSGPFAAILGPTVTSLDGWSATGMQFRSEVTPGRGQRGLYAVSFDLGPAAYALVLRAGQGESEVGDCCTALWWGSAQRLLYLSPSDDALRILAWDPTTGQQFRVSELPPPDFSPGSAWLGEFALSP